MRGSRLGESWVAGESSASRGLHRNEPGIRLESGLPEFESIEEHRGGGEARFRIDTEDSVVFPRSGADVDVVYSVSSEALGADVHFERIWGRASYAWSFGENTIVPALEYGDNLDSAGELLQPLFPGWAGPSLRSRHTTNCSATRSLWQSSSPIEGCSVSKLPGCRSRSTPV